MPTPLTDEQLAALGAAIVSSPLPVELKERIASVLDSASPEDLQKIYDAFMQADASEEALTEQFAQLDAAVRTLRQDIRAADAAEEDALVAEFSSGDLPEA